MRVNAILAHPLPLTTPTSTHTRTFHLTVEERHVAFRDVLVVNDAVDRLRSKVAKREGSRHVERQLEANAGVPISERWQKNNTESQPL